ncbi:Cupredoxin [Microdochium trichocladiopsis]|uniref:Cupredoxin n=1 Tax=Microdochium trichocladiopsis TaxID=1682393 RepID=A0A9P9BWM0_9PEZI|nr:Cupredoxin [Microdochium trichocladiopsis]KAH7041563.1 Cupredoxin [Microdochium trichocladiopsis]
MHPITLRNTFLALAASLGGVAEAKDWLSPPYTWLYQFPLPIPPVKNVTEETTNPVTGGKIQYFEVNIQPLTQQVYPGKSPAKLVGYDGYSPGPTFYMERGVESVVRFINKSPTASSIHLHGSYSRAPWDGWAEDLIKPNEYKDYYYPNHQAARTLWYHDHAIDHTAENAYFGQAGMYILHDEKEDVLGLPKGPYDVPLVLSAKQYNNDGTLYSPARETTSLYGDIIHVNGQPWPYMKVEPRQYRFRFLNAAISRSFFLYLERDLKPGQNEKLEFNVIASDAGLLSGPQKVKDMYISMAERYEVVVDFSKWKGENVTLRNTRSFAADEDFLHTDKVMKFIIADKRSDDSSGSSDDNSLPGSLRTIPYPPDKAGVDHSFKFERTNGEWKINGVSFADVNNRVLAKPKRGRVEVWELINSSGGWSHPIHIHLVDFKVVKRVDGRGQVMPYEAAGLKDVVWLGPNEKVTVEAYYAPWDGVYMFHCHNLIHEDHEMMAAFNVSMLPNLGYDETHYIDPTEKRWSAKPIGGDMSWTAVEDRIKWMANMQPYNHVDDVETWLADYWKTADDSSTKTSTAAAAAGATNAALVAGPAGSTLSTTTKPAATSTSSSKVDDSRTKSSKRKRFEARPTQVA